MLIYADNYQYLSVNYDKKLKCCVCNINYKGLPMLSISLTRHGTNFLKSFQTSVQTGHSLWNTVNCFQFTNEPMTNEVISSSVITCMSGNTFCLVLTGAFTLKTMGWPCGEISKGMKARHLQHCSITSVVIREMGSVNSSQ